MVNNSLYKSGKPVNKSSKLANELKTILIFHRLNKMTLLKLISIYCLYFLQTFKASEPSLQFQGSTSK